MQVAILLMSVRLHDGDICIVMHLSICTPTPPLPGLRGATVGHLYGAPFVSSINNVDVSKYNFGPRQRGRGLVGVTDVGVVYTPSTMCVSSVSNGSPSPLCAFHCLRGPVSVSLSV